MCVCMSTNVSMNVWCVSVGLTNRTLAGRCGPRRISLAEAEAAPGEGEEWVSQWVSQWVGVYWGQHQCHVRCRVARW